MRTMLDRFRNVWFLSWNLLLIEDWRLEEMMKTLDRPETFFKKIFETFFKQIFQKNKMLLGTDASGDRFSNSLTNR